mgnify:CR=1 FL=1
MPKEITKDSTSNAVGMTSIEQLVSLVRCCTFIVSNDTGLMHVAAAFQKPIISFWGNTSPAMGMFPYYGYNNLRDRISPQSVIMENKALGCHPCSKLGYDRCPRRHFKCMNELDMTWAVEQVKKFWTGTAKTS